MVVEEESALRSPADGLVPCAADLRRERERAGGGDGRRLRGGREWNTGSRVRDLFIRSNHDFSYWIDDRWSIIVGPVGLKRA
jgi:hypothetical protein